MPLQVDASLVIAAAVGVCAIAGAIITIVTFWMRFSDRITRAEAAAAAASKEAENALHVAAEAVEENKVIHDRLTRMGAEFALYRERAGDMFVKAPRLDEIETRLVDNMDKTERRLTDAIGGLTTRLDKLIAAGAAS